MSSTPRPDQSGERLAFADGSRIFGGRETVCAVSPRAKLGKEYIQEIEYLESEAAIQDIDEFERRHPTLPDDPEEKEIAAIAARTAALRALIPLLDVNRDGFIDRSEMRRVMPDADDAQILGIMESMDLDGDGRVTAEEWVQGILKQQEGCDESQFVEDATRLRDLLEAPLIGAAEATFLAADGDRSGKLDTFEVASILARMFHPGKGPKYEQVMAEFDTNEDGELDSEEFGRLCVYHRTFDRMIMHHACPMPLAQPLLDPSVKCARVNAHPPGMLMLRFASRPPQVHPARRGRRHLKADRLIRCGNQVSAHAL
jgi:Ca2+-binding EF-hand superfamily protein